MDTQKRKRKDGGELDEKRTRVSDDNGRVVMEPEDDEVEEFFAILRRIRVAVEYFGKGNGDGGRREFMEKRSSSRRSPSFEIKDFEEIHGVKSPGKKELVMGLDLNAEPDSEPSES